MPIAPGTHVLYTARPGDTLYSIANGFGTNVPAIVEMNAWHPPVIDTNMLYPGQRLLIRLPGMSQQSAVNYQVVEGDTLYRIGEMFSVGVDMLAGLNRLEQPDILRVAQLIYIPAFVYEVAPGDTLYRISRTFGVSMADIARMNRGRPGFSTDYLFAGYRLILPLPASTNIVINSPLPGSQVAPGTRMTGAARAFEANVNYEIRDANGVVVTSEKYFTASAGGPEYGIFDTALVFDRSPTAATGTILVYTRSANDGSIQDLTEVPIRF